MVASSAPPLPTCSRVYSLDISRDALQQLVGQVEAELLRSDIYQQALERLEKQGEGTPTQIPQAALRAVGREAIRLAMRRMIRQHRSDRPTPAQVTPISRPTQPSRFAQRFPAAAAAAQSAPKSQTPPKPKTPSASAKPETPTDIPPSGAKPPNARPPRKAQATHQRPRKTMSPEAQKRQAALVEIGTAIKQARQSQGLSLDYLHLQTWVPVYHLKALEQGKTDQLPEDIYIQGFVQRLAPLLKLDAQAVMAPLRALAPKNISPSWQPMPTAKQTTSLQPAHLYVGYAALMAGAVGGLVWMSQQPQTESWMQQLPEWEPFASEQQPAETELPDAFIAPAPVPGNGGAIAIPETAPPESAKPL